MNMQDWNDITRGLAGQRSGHRVPEREAFWAEFRSRAAGRGRAAPAAGPLRPAAWAAAAALLIAGIVFLQPFHHATAQPLNTIHALQVDVSHQAVLILNDTPSRSTILWIVAADPGKTKGAPL